MTIEAQKTHPILQRTRLIRCLSQPATSRECKPPVARAQRQISPGRTLKADLLCQSVNVQLPLHTYYANSLSALYSLCLIHYIHTEDNDIE